MTGATRAFDRFLLFNSVLKTDLPCVKLRFPNRSGTKIPL
jgi:hypothetical protein